MRGCASRRIWIRNEQNSSGCWSHTSANRGGAGFKETSTDRPLAPRIAGHGYWVLPAGVAGVVGPQTDRAAGEMPSRRTRDRSRHQSSRGDTLKSAAELRQWPLLALDLLGSALWPIAGPRYPAVLSRRD